MGSHADEEDEGARRSRWVLNSLMSFVVCGGVTTKRDVFRDVFTRREQKKAKWSLLFQFGGSEAPLAPRNVRLWVGVGCSW